MLRISCFLSLVDVFLLANSLGSPLFPLSFAVRLMLLACSAASSPSVIISPCDLTIQPVVLGAIKLD